MKKRNLILPIVLSVLLLFQNFSAINVSAQSIKSSSVNIASRLYGPDRYATSLAVAKSGWTHASNVIITTGTNFPDALSASALSKSKDAPIILTDPNCLSQDIITELRSLGTTNVYIIGGTGVVSYVIEKQLINLGISYTRLWGATRYETSRKIAEQIGVQNGIFVVPGENFPDGLSAGPIAAIKSIPVLLSPKQGLTSDMSYFLRGKQIPVSYIGGGTGVLDSSLDRSLPHSRRLCGPTRYDTNLAINTEFQNDFNFDTVYIAEGNKFPDALSGSAIAAKNNAPLILTDSDSITDDTLNFMKSKNIKHVVILGGTGAVSQAVENRINAALPLKVPVSSISLSKTSDTILTGFSDTLEAIVSPADAENKTVNWSSSDTSVASVNSTGKVSGLSSGAAEITATTEDGNLKASCLVTVVNDMDISDKISDSNFRNEVYRIIGKTSPSAILCSDVKNIKSIDLTYKFISSLNGIEYFSSLDSLKCGENQLTSLDVSHNTALTYLDCDRNQLTGLDISGNTALKTLDCSCNSISILDISRNADLTYLDCGQNNLNNLDVSHNTSLTYLSCLNNKLISLDVSGNVSINHLDCYGNKLTGLDVSHNTLLDSLELGENQVKSIDISLNPALTRLGLYSNQISSLDVSHNPELTFLDCSLNQISALDISHNTKLTDLSCTNNSLSSLDVTHNTYLRTLYLYYNQITNLDVTCNTSLTCLGCAENPIKKLDITHNTGLTDLDCSNNQLNDLDLSHNNKLVTLSCEQNLLTGLDVSNNPYIYYLNCGDNRLSNLDLSHNTDLFLIYCQNNLLKNLDLSHNTELNEFNCTENQLTSLDISQNKKLAYFNCTYNQITALYSIKDTWDTSQYKIQYTDSTHQNTTNKLVITIKN